MRIEPKVEMEKREEGGGWAAERRIWNREKRI